MGMTFQNLQLKTTDLQQVKRSLQEKEMALQLSDEWITVIVTDYFDNLDDRAKQLSEEFQTSVLAVDYFDDDILEIKLYQCGTKRARYSNNDGEKNFEEFDTWMNVLGLSKLQRQGMEYCYKRVMPASEDINILVDLLGIPLFLEGRVGLSKNYEKLYVKKNLSKIRSYLMKEKYQKKTYFNDAIILKDEITGLESTYSNLDRDIIRVILPDEQGDFNYDEVHCFAVADDSFKFRAAYHYPGFEDYDRYILFTSGKDDNIKFDYLPSGHTFSFSRTEIEKVFYMETKDEDKNNWSSLHCRNDNLIRRSAAENHTYIIKRLYTRDDEAIVKYQFPEGFEIKNCGYNCGYLLVNGDIYEGKKKNKESYHGSYLYLFDTAGNLCKKVTLSLPMFNISFLYLPEASQLLYIGWYSRLSKDGVFEHPRKMILFDVESDMVVQSVEDLLCNQLWFSDASGEIWGVERGSVVCRMNNKLEIISRYKLQGYITKAYINASGNPCFITFDKTVMDDRVPLDSKIRLYEIDRAV